MKDQYFGDINDYLKYALLRAIARSSGLRLLVAWMLTPNDGSTDGKFRSYLCKPEKWACYDPELFHGLNQLLTSGRQPPQVNMMEKAGLLENAAFYPAVVPDKKPCRDQWFKSLFDDHAKLCDFVFLDPDTGLEVKSRPYGRKHSSKYLYWSEVSTLWSSGKSLLIYQHFARKERRAFVQCKLKALKGSTPDSFVEAFSTPRVVFLMALQREHRRFHQGIVTAVQKQWAGQIEHIRLTCAR